MRSSHTPPRKFPYKNYTVSDLLRLASGRWIEILQAAGMPSDAIDGRRGRPCPRCGGNDRYAPMADVAERGAVLCRSCLHASTEPRAGDGIATLRWWMGCNAVDAIRWLASYLGVGDAVDTPVISRPIERRLPLREHSKRPDQWRMMAEVFISNMRPAYISRAAELLGLPTEPLERLGVGWSPSHRATSWPMRNGAGDVIGIRMRCPSTGEKWAIKGSQAGLIFDARLLSIDGIERLYVVEGPTDTAAMLSIGCDAVGCPSAGCGGDLLIELSRRIKPTEIVIVADADSKGAEGAERIADELLIVAPIRIIYPGDSAKDARSWVVSGADRSKVDSVADDAPMRRLLIGGLV